MLGKLNKDLLIKLIENINDPHQLTDEELDQRINIYGQIKREREWNKRTEIVRQKLLNLAVIPCFTEVIENNRENIQNLKFDFSEIHRDSYYFNNFNKNIVKKVNIYYENKWQDFPSLFKIPSPLFQICINGKNVEFWYDVLNYAFKNDKGFLEYNYEKVNCEEHGYHILATRPKIVEKDGDGEWVMCMSTSLPKCIVTEDYPNIRFSKRKEHPCFQ